MSIVPKPTKVLPKMHKSRVLIIVENLPLPNDRRVWMEARQLVESGYQVSTISIKGKNATKSYEMLEGVRIYRYPAPPETSGSLSFVFEFAYCWICTFFLSLVIAFREGFDIIQACNPPDTFWLLAWFYKPFGKKYIFDHHDPCPDMYLARFGKKGIAYQLLILLEKMTFWTADVVMTVNGTMAKRGAMGRGNLPEDKVFVLQNAPDPGLEVDIPNDDTTKRGFRQVVSYLGVLNPQDGVDSFVQAAKIMVEEHNQKDVLFVVMGAGDAEADLQKLTETLGIADQFHFTGWADLDIKRQYLSVSDVCVDTAPKDDYSDLCTPNKILEYMSMGKPMVTFDLTETRALAQNAALYAEPGDIHDMADKIVGLLDSPEIRTQMGEFGRRRVAIELAWRHQKHNLLAAYEAVQDSSQPAEELIQDPLGIDLSQQESGAGD